MDVDWQSAMTADVAKSTRAGLPHLVGHGAATHWKTPSFRFRQNPPWPIGCPLARLYAESLRHVPKGAQGHRGTSWMMSAGHLVVTLMHVLSPYNMMSRERSENNSTFHKGVHEYPAPPPTRPSMTVPGISHGRLLLSPQQWRSRALASSQGTHLPCYLCTWKCLWIQVRDCIRSATRAAVYYTTSEGASALKWAHCYRPFFQRPWNNNGLWLERYLWVTLAAFHKVELFTVRWIKERVVGDASLFHMNDGVGGQGRGVVIHFGREVY